MPPGILSHSATGSHFLKGAISNALGASYMTVSVLRPY